jgi:hypothetical protein
MNTKCMMVSKPDVAANRETWRISWTGGASCAQLRCLDSVGGVAEGRKDAATEELAHGDS